jgi:predicted amidohydrolase
MEMKECMKYYSAAAIQFDRHFVSSRKEIRSNAERAVKLIDWAVRGHMVGPRWAPTKLVVFPEVFLQGWRLEK